MFIGNERVADLGVTRKEFNAPYHIIFGMYLYQKSAIYTMLI